MPDRARKEEYCQRMTALLDEYNKFFLVSADHVGSLQFQNIRKALRGKAVVLMGKNTMMRRIVKQYVDEHPGHAYTELIPLLVGNVGIIFTNGDLGEVREVIDDNRVPAAAKAGVVAECDVRVPPGPTGCDPGQTSWFQALNVPTKISRGQIEIVSELLLVKQGEKVGASEAGLLQKLNIKPFTYGLKLESVYSDGNIFSAAVLDLSDEVLTQKFCVGLKWIAAIGLEAGYPTVASFPFSLNNAIKRLIAISAMTEYSFPAMAAWNAIFNMDPEELAKLQAAAAAAAGAGAGEEKKEEEKEEEEEMDVGGGAGLFGGDEDGY